MNTENERSDTDVTKVFRNSEYEKYLEITNSKEEYLTIEERGVYEKLKTERDERNIDISNEELLLYILGSGDDLSSAESMVRYMFDHDFDRHMVRGNCESEKIESNFSYSYSLKGMGITHIQLDERRLSTDEKKLYEKLKKERDTKKADVCDEELLDNIIYGEQFEIDEDGKDDYSRSLILIENIIRSLINERCEKSKSDVIKGIPTD